MDEKQILEKIIDEEGSCCWATPKICEQCPLSKLKQRPDGTYLSCAEAIKIDGDTEKDADARYKEIACRVLTDMSIEEYIL